MGGNDPKKEGGQGQTKVLERPEVKVEKPRMYRVILHNDDYTTMEFVVRVLVEVFRKPVDEAFELMLRVHHSGQAMVGVYTREIAEARSAEATRLAREAGYPLRISMEPDSP